MDAKMELKWKSLLAGYSGLFICLVLIPLIGNAIVHFIYELYQVLWDLWNQQQ